MISNLNDEQFVALMEDIEQRYETRDVTQEEAFLFMSYEITKALGRVRDRVKDLEEYVVDHMDRRDGESRQREELLDA